MAEGGNKRGLGQKSVLSRFFNRRLLKMYGPPYLKKCYFSWTWNFLVNGMDNLTLHFAYRSRYSLSIDCHQTCWIILHQSPTLGGGTLHSVAHLGLSVVFADAYEIAVLRSCWHYIAIYCISLHVKFEIGLLISVLRSWATSSEKQEFKSMSF